MNAPRPSRTSRGSNCETLQTTAEHFALLQRGRDADSYVQEKQGGGRGAGGLREYGVVEARAPEPVAEGRRVRGERAGPGRPGHADPHRAGAGEVVGRGPGEVHLA